MATTSITIYPEARVEWRGISVYPTFKYDDYDQGAEHYYFTTNQTGGEDDGYVFDVRDLDVPAVALLEEFKPMFKTGDGWAQLSVQAKAEVDKEWERYHDIVEPMLIDLALKQAINDQLLALVGDDYTNYSAYPESTNASRAMMFELALQAYQSLTGAESDTAAADLLCDMRHWIDRSDKFDIDTLLLESGSNYVAEVEDETCHG